MKKLLLLVLLGMSTAVVDSYCQDIKLPEGFSIVDTTNPYVMVKTPYADYPVELLDFEPKEVLSVKWGLGKEDIAQEYYTAAEAIQDEIRPDYAINSKGEIYILDAFNNRIQKFNAQGSHEKSIPVYGRADKNGKTAVRKTAEKYYTGANEAKADGVIYRVDREKLYYYGRSIELDTLDNPYYLVQKGRNQWEVWKFSDDLLLWKKHVVVDVGLRVYDELNLSEEDGQVYAWLTKPGMGTVKKCNPETGETAPFIYKPGKRNQRVGYKVEVIERKERIVGFIRSNGGSIRVKIPNVMQDYEVAVPHFCFLFDGFIKVYVGVRAQVDSFVFKYNRSSKLIGIYIKPSIVNPKYYEEKYGKYGDGFGQQLGNNGEIYMGYFQPQGIRILMNELYLVKKTNDKK